jgi:hypothetical protein
MKEMIRFAAVEVVSQVMLVSGRDRHARFEIVSMILIPSTASGRPLITDALLPEIFMQ